MGGGGGGGGGGDFMSDLAKKLAMRKKASQNESVSGYLQFVFV